MNAQPNITSLLCNPPPMQPTTDVMPFDFEGAQERTVNIDGEPYFVGIDVCERLGYANPSDAMKQHCRGVVKRYPIVDALGRVQKARASPNQTFSASWLEVTHKAVRAFGTTSPACNGSSPPPLIIRFWH